MIRAAAILLFGAAAAHAQAPASCARDAQGKPAPVPAGARVRFRGAEEVRGVVQPDGGISVTRVRRRR